MRKAAKQILLCALALVLFCILCRLLIFRQFSVYIPVMDQNAEAVNQGNTQITMEQPDILQPGGIEVLSGYVRIPIVPKQQGETGLIFQAGDESFASYHIFRVDRFNTVYDASTGDFTGDSAVLIAVTLFWLLVSAIMGWHFSRAKGPAFYDYRTIYYAGFSLFSLSTGLEMLYVSAMRLIHPESFHMMSALSSICGASMRYMSTTAPLIFLFAIAMAVSNIALLRHERPRIQNALGLLVSVLLVLGEWIGWILFSRDFMGSELEGRINNTIENTYATVFVYFQCMLTGAVICGIKSARYIPAPDKDYIIILGCWFRPDGTLPPLLRGRVDRAIAFWRRQKELTGKEACFIPSGGQGKNEPMPEAEAMRRYMLSQGVEDRLILPETRSANTYQNMAFSNQLIPETDSRARIAFSTTNYHVFRSGLWARQAGLSAEGMGSQTKWWFWPNAFMRETAGLLLHRWRQELLFLLLLIVFFALLSMIL